MWPAAFLLGLAGSLHCVAMCGPIALALPLDRAARGRLLASLFVYNSGRILTYAMLGAAFGLVSQVIEVAGFQKWMTVAAGVFLLGLAFFSVRMESRLTSLPGLGPLFFWIKDRLARLLKINSNSSFFAVGLLNGLVPCGLVYAAIAATLTTGSPVRGAFFMLLFGLGTWPLMLVLGFGGQFFKSRFRQKMNWIQPILLGVAGVLILFRAFHIDLAAFQNAFPRLVPMCH